MKKHLFTVMLLLLMGCSVAPVTRYSSSSRKEGFGAGIDVSMGRRMESGISEDGTVDSTYKSVLTDMAYPILGLNIYNNFGNLMVNGKVYGSFLSSFGACLGVDYYFLNESSSPFAGFDIATSQSEGESMGSDYSYSGYSFIGVLGYSRKLNKNITATPMIRGGVSMIEVKDSTYTIPELGVGVNASLRFLFLDLTPEVFVNLSKLPDGDWATGLYPGIYMGVNF